LKRNKKILSVIVIVCVCVGTHVKPSSPLRSPTILPIRWVGRPKSEISTYVYSGFDEEHRFPWRNRYASISTTFIELSNYPFDDIYYDIDNNTSTDIGIDIDIDIDTNTNTNITTSLITIISPNGNKVLRNRAPSNFDTSIDASTIGNYSDTTSELRKGVDDLDVMIPFSVIEDNINESKDNIGLEKMIRFLREDTQSVSILLLNFVAILWGSQHAIIKTIVDDSDPAGFTFLRFGLASLISFPYLPGIKETTNKFDSLHNDDKENEYAELWKPWRWGFEMGLWMFFGFALQAIGLQSTTAQRSGFLLYLNVKLVPFFAYILLGRQISKTTWISAFTAFSGTALIALDGQSIGINEGDFWSVLAAAASAMFILRLEKASKEVSKSAELNSTSLFVVAVLSGIWLMFGSFNIIGDDLSSPHRIQNLGSELSEIVTAHPFGLLYLGVISTALANFIQAKAQKEIPAERASIIYSLDPVYGAFFSWILLGENIGGPQAYIGASMIFLAAATNSLLEFSNEEERSV